MASLRICAVEGCGKPVAARTWCMPHYRRWLRHGDPSAGKAPHGALERFYRDVVLPYDGDECLLWPYSRTTGGYAQLNDGQKKLLAHRLVCQHVNGPPPTPKHDAAHRCGGGKNGCVTPRHLRWATRAENEGDKIRHGTHQFGEQNPNASLSDEDVRQIKMLRGETSQREIAARFGISQSAVSMIQTGARWGFEPPP